MKILFLTPYPYGIAPSQRFRYEQYLPFLQEQGIEYRLAPFLDHPSFAILYQQGNHLSKAIGVFKGFIRRFLLLFSIHQYDFVFIHREAAPLGPPIFEWIIAKVMGKKLIYDFDDAIWLPNISESNKIAAGLKWHGKVSDICRWSWKVSCGNDYLCHYARQYNSQVVLNPTTIDTINLHNRLKDQKEPQIVIGWTGTHSTIRYLFDLVPVLEKLESEFAFEFLVISNQDPEIKLKSFRYKAWSKESEIDDLLRFCIGIMPLTEDPWSEGKCGFKALQYMALGVPPVASPVGVNTKIIEEGVNGYLCNSDEEWYDKLRLLLSDSKLRENLGLAARKKVEEHYSVRSNKENFLSLFR